MNSTPPRAGARQRRAWRAVDGILLLDKPLGLTSNDALQRVRRLLQAAKAGHTGSLDPLATGMLPLCFGQATKVCGLLLAADKRYRVSVSLGSRTSTADAEGQVVEQRPVPAFTESQLAAALTRFRGPIAQIPPMHSALKHEGQRLYTLARAGIEVERAPRSVVIHELQLLTSGETTLELEVQCSKGTYIRSLAEDLSAALGTVGHVTKLHRLWSAPFSGREMYPLEQLEAAMETSEGALQSLLLPPDAALVGWPAVHLDAAGAGALRHGQQIALRDTPAMAGQVRVYGPEGSFLGVGEVLPGAVLRPVRLMSESVPEGP